METGWGAGSRLGELSGEGTHVWGSGDSWDPLWLLADEVIAAARDRYGQSAERPALLADGLWNQSWRLSTPDGAVVLRVIRPDLPLDQIRYEHETTARLHVQIAEAVVPLPGVDGDTVQHWGELLVVLFPFIAGTTAAALPAKYRRAYREAGGPVGEAELELVPGLARRQALLELQFAVDEAGHAKPQAVRKLREVTAALRTLPAADEPE